MNVFGFTGRYRACGSVICSVAVIAACTSESTPSEPDGATAPELRRAETSLSGPVDLGAYGGVYSLAIGINARGQVVGGNSIHFDYPYKALIWFRGAVIDLGQFGGGAMAWAVNDRGQVVGGGASGFLWERGIITDLGEFGARDINNAGDIAGQITAANGWEHVAVWRRGKVTDLGTLLGSEAPSYVVGINNRGQVVGEGPAPGWASGDYHAILWDHGVMRDLGAWRPADINDRGQIVGLKWIDAFTNHVVVWENGALTDLGLDDFYPHGIGQRGEIVGAVEDETGTWRGVIWRAGKLTYLGALGGNRSEAFAINSRGQVVGTAENAAGESHAVMWQVR
jgi:probable HAF family extracellular repeat protein